MKKKKKKTGPKRAKELNITNTPTHKEVEKSLENVTLENAEWNQ
jgi:hypothetical protein